MGEGGDWTGQWGNVRDEPIVPVAWGTEGFPGHRMSRAEAGKAAGRPEEGDRSTTRGE